MRLKTVLKNTVLKNATHHINNKEADPLSEFLNMRNLFYKVMPA